jgi:hypothetical protein
MTDDRDPAAAWNTLVSAVTLGVERAGEVQQPLRGPWSVASANGDRDPVSAWLDEAAALAIYVVAGRNTPKGSVAPPPPLTEGERQCSPAAATLLVQILYGNRSSLLSEWCDAAVEAGEVAPPELLPRLLELVPPQGAPVRRGVLERVCGKRGAWVAALNPDWATHADGDRHDGKEAWETGDKRARLEALRQRRQTDPAEVLEWLDATWGADPAVDRAHFVAELEANLSTADEPWLERRLDDSSKQVRAAIVNLLSRLPSSAFAARMAERVVAVVQFRPKSGFLMKSKAALFATPPDSPDTAWVREGLDGKLPGLGPKAAVLCQLATLAPLGAWDGGESDPNEWVGTALASDWAEALVQGWSAAATRQQNAAWAEALLSGVWLRRSKEPNRVDPPTSDDWRLRLVAPLYRKLPRDAAERVLRDFVDGERRLLPDCAIDESIEACDFAWSVPTSRAVVPYVGRRLAAKDAVFDQSARRVLRMAAHRMATDVADGLAAAWAGRTEHWSGNFSEFVHDAIDVVRFRRDLRGAFAAASP